MIKLTQSWNRMATGSTAENRKNWPLDRKIDAYAGNWNIGFVLRLLHRLGRDRLMENMAKLGVTAGYWYYLWALYLEDGLSQAELARRVRNVGPTAFAALSKMERAGLITRRRNSDDRRAVQVFLTEKAHALRPQLYEELTLINEKSLELLSDAEVAQLFHLLEKVRCSLDTEP
ncbi:MAG: MarR family transcriptional regulator [Bosea sp.]|uniref:MarR family transcriptional regulator n=1 Tax=Bosea sp. (in: a-proteobacteria) TaxID=1871050 RepID=UPI001484EA56|nr:MarR family transcriptional regulator [Bosea sp. (in: a-proteobacteria)]MCP4734868.1 MarR family transcriptional regulator [Bosea sp. (in: a-proteobacteria)]